MFEALLDLISNTTKRKEGKCGNEQVYAYKFDDLREINQFLEEHNLERFMNEKKKIGPLSVK